MHHDHGKLVLIIGPSGVGKSVILRELKARHPELVFPRSATTRPRRKGEGHELYEFVTDEVFTAWIAEGRFLEFATVHRGARYGTLLSEILPAIEEGKIVVREVDVQGFRSIRDHAFFRDHTRCLQTIFILPENEEQLRRHITKRAPMPDVELQQRLQSMKEELAAARETDVQVTNAEGFLDQTIASVETAVLS